MTALLLAALLATPAPLSALYEAFLATARRGRVAEARAEDAALVCKALSRTGADGHEDHGRVREARSEALSCRSAAEGQARLYNLLARAWWGLGGNLSGLPLRVELVEPGWAVRCEYPALYEGAEG